MANTCGLFGDIVPNIYIDKVFLEESHVGTQQDKDGNFTSFLQTPVITVQLKVLDSVSDGGTFSILGDALQFQSSNGTVDLKKYFKVHCILFTSQDLAENFISNFEKENYTETSNYFSLPQIQSQETYLKETKDLNDFINTYENADGITEINRPFFFDLNEADTISYLRVFAFVELDTKTLEADLGDIDLPASYKNIIGRYRDEVVINNSEIVEQLTIFVTEDGDLWDDSFHVHNPGSGNIYMEGRVHTPDIPHGVLTKVNTTVFNVQDFRIRDEIDAFIANLNLENSVQNTFPEQSDILNKALSNKSYFSQLFITKDADRNVRYHFAFDYGAYVLENVKFSNIVKSMSAEGRKKIIDNSEILNLTVSRIQVQNQPYPNRLGSPLQNRIASDGTIKTPLIGGSLGGENLNEIFIILSEQPDTADSIIRNFTGLDELMKDTEDGVFQYFVDVEINDGFVPVMREVLANLSNAVASYNDYVALANIPGVYDEQSRKFTSTPANPSSVIVNGEIVTTMTGQEIMNSFGTDNLIDIINTYLNTLDLFVEIDKPLGAFLSQSTSTETMRRVLQNNLGRNISPTVGSVDGIILFEKLLNDLLGTLNDVLSIGSNSVGVQATTTDRKADSISSFRTTTIKTSETFENTIDARFLNESYVNNISTDFGEFNGLNIYTGENLANATRTEVSPINLFLTQQEALAQKGVIFNSLPSTAPSIDLSSTNVSSTKYLGQDSEGAIGNLNSQNLNPQDLEIVKLSDMIPAPALSAFDPNAQSVAKSVLTENELKTEVDVLVGFTVRGVVNVAQYQQTFTNTYMIKGAQFETKKLGELSTPTGTGFYLCRQKRQSDVEVIDTFFLLPPVSSTFATGTDLIAQDPGQFLQEDTPAIGPLTEQITQLDGPSPLARVTNPLNIPLQALTQPEITAFADLPSENQQQVQTLQLIPGLVTRGY
jgi:hypothetical protein